MKRKPPASKEGVAIVAPTSIEPDLKTRRMNGKDVTLVHQVREYELITPLFGGGPVTQHADPISVIRVPSIRGQLRFWWRAIRGGQFGSMERMKQREDEIFGAASMGDKATPSQVQIDLRIQSRGRDLLSVLNQRGTEHVPIHHLSSPYGYIAFPLREENLGVVEGVSFSLSLSYPVDVRPEIESALWAWEMFGGIGGRTRRGFGALQLKTYRPRASELQKEMEEGFGRNSAGNDFPPNVPHVSSPASIKVTSAHSSVDAAWKYLISELRQFRQDRAWNHTKRKPGRSNWHEPDAIRLLFKTTTPHSPSPTTVSKYPRAAFGLPIIFQFAAGDVAAGDPPPTTLEGKDDNQKRMASPLILRPLVCANNQAVGLAIRLLGTGFPPSGIILNGAPGNPSVNAGLTPAEAKTITPLGSAVDVLQAFLDRLK